MAQASQKPCGSFADLKEKTTIEQINKTEKIVAKILMYNFSCRSKEWQELLVPKIDLDAYKTVNVEMSRNTRSNII